MTPTPIQVGVRMRTPNSKYDIAFDICSCVCPLYILILHMHVLTQSHTSKRSQVLQLNKLVLSFRTIPLTAWPNPGQVPTESFQFLFSKLDFSEECKNWDLEADLCRALKYVRGSKKLKIPSGWRPFIPQSIPFQRLLCFGNLWNNSMMCQINWDLSCS